MWVTTSISEKNTWEEHPKQLQLLKKNTVKVGMCMSSAAANQWQLQKLHRTSERNTHGSQITDLDHEFHEFHEFPLGPQLTRAHGRR